jgi:hypothetical protein
MNHELECGLWDKDHVCLIPINKLVRPEKCACKGAWILDLFFEN